MNTEYPMKVEDYEEFYLSPRYSGLETVIVGKRGDGRLQDIMAFETNDAINHYQFALSTVNLWNSLRHQKSLL